MVKVRMAQYAGVSLVVAEDGTQSAHFHTSNQPKYACWANMPEKENGTFSVSYQWVKMPSGFNKFDAAKKLLGLAVATNPLVKKLLEDVVSKGEPKPKKERKAKTVTVEVSKKKLSNEEAAKVKAATLEKIKAAAAKRKAGK